MPATRWGIVSTGQIAHDYVAAIKILPKEDHQVVAVCARDLGRAQEFAKTFDIPQAYGSYQELANDPNVEIVYIGVIHNHHYPVTTMMLNAGKHVLCEKPLAVNSREAKEMCQLAKNKKLFLMEGFWSRFFPATQQLLKEIENNTIGEVKLVQAQFGFAMSHKERINSKEMCGGSLMDVGCYPLQFANMIFKGKPEKIVASGTLLPTGVDEMVTITLHYSNNRVAQLISHCGAELSQNGYVYGTKGCLTLPFFWSPSTLKTPTQTYDFPLPESSIPMNFFHSQGFSYEAQSVRESLLKGELENPLLPFEDSLQIMEILDEVRAQIGVKYAQDD